MAKKYILPTDANNTPLYGHDLDEGINKSGMYQWDQDAMAWVRYEGATINVDSLSIDLTDTNALLDDLIEAVQAGPTELARMVDEASPTVMYVGEAAPGTPVDTAGWRIKKIDMTTGIAILWAGGNANFTNRWDQRANPTYS